MDAHRSTAYIVGPCLKHNATVSTHCNTVDRIERRYA